MKPWRYYATPKDHPWVGSKEIDEFKKAYPSGWVAQFIWDSDNKTKDELRKLEEEFITDVCEELGITRKEYIKLDPYDYVIGNPEDRPSPTESEYIDMFLYLLKKTKKNQA